VRTETAVWGATKPINNAISEGKLMVFINIKQKKNIIILDCHKSHEDGEYFRIVLDARTREVIERPEHADIDASAAYSCVYGLLEAGVPLPERTVAEWG
jgi:hypothetical protein